MFASTFQQSVRLSEFAAFGLAMLVALPASAAPPVDPAARSELIGRPVALTVQPESIALTGPRAMQQIVVTGRYADGTMRDLTPFCDLAMENADIAGLNPGGFLLSQKNGSTVLVVKASPLPSRTWRNRSQFASAMSLSRP